MSKPRKTPLRRPRDPSLVRSAYRPGATGKIVNLRFPAGYLRILEEEGKALGLQRSQFLAFLGNRGLGRFGSTRAPGLPQPAVTEEELDQSVDYGWRQPDDLVERLYIGRRRVGLGLSQYMILLLNDWLGNIQGPEIRGSKRGA